MLNYDLIMTKDYQCIPTWPNYPFSTWGNAFNLSRKNTIYSGLSYNNIIIYLICPAFVILSWLEFRIL